MASANTQASSHGEFVAEPDRENECRARLREYLTRIGQEPVDRNVDELFSLQSGVCDRFNYLAPRMPEGTRLRLLVSGCAAGSEMIIARRYGFQEIFGTDVAPDYIAITRQRLLDQSGFGVFLYDGRNLPFASDAFTAIVSGHIIEHTPSPYGYLKEHMRVLAPGGFLFLEFPNRYYPIELHTGLPSLEHLPRPLRFLGLKCRSSGLSRFTPHQRNLYKYILETIRPVSVWQIKMYLSLMSLPTARVAHQYSPAAGFTRMLITK